MVSDARAGNEIMHAMTNDGRRHRVRFELWDFERRWRWGEYNEFTVGPESKEYTLTRVGRYETNVDGPRNKPGRES